MKRFQKFLAVMGILLGVTAAFAFKSSPKFAGEFGIQGETTNSYIVYLTPVTSMTEGTHFRCDPQTASNCTLTTNLNPSPINATQGKISKASSPTLNRVDFRFVKL